MGNHIIILLYDFNTIIKMVNYYLGILWFIIVVIILAGIVLIAVAIINETITHGNNFFPPTPCSENVSGLTSISEIPCCFSNGLNSSLKYLSEDNLTLAPFPTYYIDVCIGFCPTGSFNPTTKQCVTGNTAALTDFNNCVSLLQPQQCQGAALPIAVDGAIVYYGYQAGNVNCQLCCPCGVQDCDPTQC